jgi:4-amino-4-deoxy-L-arabinose transferase-like glycosyltransferase
MRRAWVLLLPVPLLLTAAPRSYLAHDEGYYALQARWILEQGDWLAPLWWGQPLYDRTIGVQWAIASSFRLFGTSSLAAHLPSLLAAVACLALTHGLVQALAPEGTPPGGKARLSAPLAVAVLALTPLWMNYAHLASQDMPLLAVELLGLLGLVRARPGAPWPWAALAGLSVGLAFLIKGFMVALPLVAIAPYLWIARRRVLAHPALWAGLVLGWLPVVLWLGLSIQVHGLQTVSGLWLKLLFLSGSDVYSGGPFYYLWNIPANTAPWILAALPGWWLGLRGAWNREQKLLLAVYPLLLLLLLSCFRTKTPYYGLQITPFLAMAAAQGLQHWAERPGRWIAGAIASLGGVLLLGAALLALPATGLAQRLGPVPPPELLTLAGAALGIPWLLLAWSSSPRQRLVRLLLGPWLALVVLVQGGLFTDRSPQLARALAAPELQALLGPAQVQVVAPDPLGGEDHAQLILLALGTPQLGGRLQDPAALRPGQRAWMRTPPGQSEPPKTLRQLAGGRDLGDWWLVEKP